MAYEDLQDFIETLEEKGELIEIDFPVSSELEITEITDRASKEQGIPNKALLFNNVEGYKIPVLTNAFGSFDRMALSLGVDNVKEIAERIESLVKLQIPDSLFGKAALVPKVYEMSQVFPQMVTDAPCQEVMVKDPTAPILDKLPILKCWPEDGGSFITLPLVITKNPQPETGIWGCTGFRNTAIQLPECTGTSITTELRIIRKQKTR